MTSTNQTLLAALQTSNMLEIDGLHAWEFSLGDEHLKVEAIDGRERKFWRFSLAQVQAATFDTQLQSWTLSDDNADHRIVCLSAFTPSDDDADEDVDVDDASGRD